MSRAKVREQVQAHYRAERLAIMLEDGDVTETEAGWIVDCEAEAALMRQLGEQPACTCGTHAWGPS